MIHIMVDVVTDIVSEHKHLLPWSPLLPLKYLDVDGDIAASCERDFWMKGTCFFFAGRKMKQQESIPVGCVPTVVDTLPPCGYPTPCGYPNPLDTLSPLDTLPIPLDTLALLDTSLGTLTPRKDMEPEICYPMWEHYLAATSLTVGKNPKYSLMWSRDPMQNFL